MNTALINAIAQLDIIDINNIDEYVSLLKTRKKQLRMKKMAMSKAIKDIEKSDREALNASIKSVMKEHSEALNELKRSEKDAIKIVEKNTLIAQAVIKTVEKTDDTNICLSKLQNATYTDSKLESEMSSNDKNQAYQNFTRWLKNDNGPSVDKIFYLCDSKKQWLKSEWAKITEEQRYAVDAPWNVHV